MRMTVQSRDIKIAMFERISFSHTTSLISGLVQRVEKSLSSTRLRELVTSRFNEYRVSILELHVYQLP